MDNQNETIGSCDIDAVVDSAVPYWWRAAELRRSVRPSGKQSGDGIQSVGNNARATLDSKEAKDRS